MNFRSTILTFCALIKSTISRAFLAIYSPTQYELSDVSIAAHCGCDEPHVVRPGNWIPVIHLDNERRRPAFKRRVALAFRFGLVVQTTYQASEKISQMARGSDGTLSNHAPWPPFDGPGARDREGPANHLQS